MNNMFTVSPDYSFPTSVTELSCYQINCGANQSSVFISSMVIWEICHIYPLLDVKIHLVATWIWFPFTLYETTTLWIKLVV